MESNVIWRASARWCRHGSSRGVVVQYMGRARGTTGRLFRFRFCSMVNQTPPRGTQTKQLQSYPTIKRSGHLRFRDPNYPEPQTDLRDDPTLALAQGQPQPPTPSGLHRSTSVTLRLTSVTHRTHVRRRGEFLMSSAAAATIGPAPTMPVMPKASFTVHTLHPRDEGEREVST